MNSKVMHNSNSKRQTIKVCIRLRPLLPHEDIEYWNVDQQINSIHSVNAIPTINTSKHNKNEINKRLMDSIYTPQLFQFDRIYEKNSSSEIIYQENCNEIIQKALKGFNGSIFSYGQTTSGKTFTMLGTRNEPGILPCAFQHLFELIRQSDQSIGYKVYCTYIEIYNETIFDLLNDSNTQLPLKLIDDLKYGVIVSGARHMQIESFEEGIALSDFGEEKRKYRETLINEYSSRSHTIFQIFIESSAYDNSNHSVITKYSFLNLVDLAGSEKLSENESSSGETGHINKSLFVLANVVNKLAEGKKAHIPYRDSKLTRVLSQALGGNSLICIICTISPAAINYYQTLSTLRFAFRAKAITLKPNVKEYHEKRQLEIYRNEIKKHKEELKINDNNSFDMSNINNNNNSISEDYKSKYLNEVFLNKTLQNENMRLRKQNQTNSNQINQKNEVTFLDDFIYQINDALKQTGLDKDYICYCQNELNNLNNEYRSQLSNAQDYYLKKISDFHKQIVNNLQNKQDNDQETSVGDIKDNVSQDNVFQSIKLDFDYIRNSQSIDKSIQDLKFLYEERVDLLEKKYIETKKEIEVYFNDYYIQLIQTSQENEKDKEIIKENITNELKTQVNVLAQLYSSNQKVLEKVTHYYLFISLEFLCDIKANYFKTKVMSKKGTYQYKPFYIRVCCI